MDIEYDPDKDESNVRKHGISLSRAKDMEILFFIEDTRQTYGETRYRAWGLIDGLPHSLAFTYRAARLRAISLRRAHRKEFESHVQRQQ